MAEDVASLGFEIDSSAFVESETRMRAFEAMAKRLGVTVGEVQARVRAASGATVANTAATGQSAAATAAATREMERAAASAARMAREAALVGRVLGAVSGEAQSLAGALGRVAPILISLGPVGIAAAAGLGLGVIAIKKLADEALRIAEVGGALKDMAETTGFTVVQLQALEQAGARVGISAGQMSTGLERFTFNLNQAHEGGGDLFNTLREVDHSLALELARTQSTAEAWDVLTKAIEKAGSAEQKVAIARAAGGRGAAGFARLAGEGNIGQMVSQLKEVDRISAEQADRWDRFGDAISESFKKARNNLASIFADEVLEKLNEFADRFLDFSRELKSTSPSAPLQTFLESLIDPQLVTTMREITALLRVWDSIKGAATSFITDTNAAQRAEMAQGQATIDAARSTAQLQNVMEGLDTTITDVLAPLALLTAALQTAGVGAQQLDAHVQGFKQNLQILASESKRNMEVLGSAATPQEKFAAKQTELNAVVSKFPEQAGNAQRALAAFHAEMGASRTQAEIDVLGSAATALEEYNAKVVALTEKARTAGVSQEILNRGIKGLQLDEAIRKLEDNVTALGEAATEAEKYEAAVAKLNQRLGQGKISQDVFERSTRALNPALKAVQDAVADIGSSLARAFIEGADGAEALNRSLKSVASTAASSAINNLIKGDLGAAAVSGAISAVSFLASSFFGGDDKEAIAAQQQAQQQAVDSFLAAKDALAGVVDQFRKLAEVAKGPVTSSIRDAQTQLQGLVRAAEAQKSAAVTLGTTFGGGTPQSAAAAQAFEEANAAIREGESALRAYGERTIENAREALRGSDSLTEVGQALSDLRKQADDINDAMNALGTSSQQAADSVRNDLAVAIDRLRVNFVDKLTSGINEATGRGFVNQISELMDTLKDAAALGGVDQGLLSTFISTQAQAIVDSSQVVGDAFADLLKTFPQLTGLIRQFGDTSDAVLTRAKALDDRLFAAVVDSTTLEGTLAAFERDAERQREEEQRLGGANLVKLETVLAFERLDIVQRFADEAVEAERQASQERQDAINAASRNIVNYVNGLLSGSTSTLSPGDRLAAAQAAYNSQLTLAQGGNTDAAANITQYADDLLQAARDFYGSTTQFQTLFTQVANQLLALPAVQSSTDIIVNALRDTTLDQIAAINSTTGAVNTNTNATNTTTGAVNSTTSAVNTTTNTVAGTTQAVDSAKSVLNTIEALTNATNSQISTTNALQTSANSLSNSANSFLDQMRSLLDSINNLQSTANSSLSVQSAQLTALNNQFSHSPIFEPFVGSVDNNMLDALNKIVINSAEIVGNTARTAINTAQPDVHGSLSTAGVSFAYHVARGGWVQGGTRGVDSVPLLAMPDEYVLSANATRALGRGVINDYISQGRLPGVGNDNSMIAELRALREEVHRLRGEMASGFVVSAEHVREGTDNVADVMREMASESKLNAQAA